MLSFDELCGKPLAAADYVALAGRFHSVAISGVPRVTPANRPAAYRFMILIDVLYEQRCEYFVQCTCALMLCTLHSGSADVCQVAIPPHVLFNAQDPCVPVGRGRAFRAV